MADVTLPSGQIVKSPWSEEKPSEPDMTNMEATAGAMTLEIDGQCPKCSRQMGVAIASGEKTYYCDPCRVCLPLPIND